MAGVFIVEGMSLQIPAGAITLHADGRITADPIIPQLRFDVWPQWLITAREHVRLTEAAYSELQAAIERDDDGAKGKYLAEEFRAAAVSLSACAFAVDAFYASVYAHMPKRPTKAKAGRKTARHRWIAETLRQAFKASPESASQWRAFLRTLFAIRDAAVHPSAEFRDAILREDVGIGTEWHFTVFTAPQAIRAYYATTTLIYACLGTEQTDDEFRQWSSLAAAHFMRSVGEGPPRPE